MTWSSGPANLGGDISTIPAAVVSSPGTTNVALEDVDGDWWHVYSTDYGATCRRQPRRSYATV
jgi:hypothetical protein